MKSVVNAISCSGTNRCGLTWVKTANINDCARVHRDERWSSALVEGVDFKLMSGDAPVVLTVLKAKQRAFTGVDPLDVGVLVLFSWSFCSGFPEHGWMPWFWWLLHRSPRTPYPPLTPSSVLGGVEDVSWSPGLRPYR